VQVEKLPSCPDTWPKNKCPPELCIQIGGYEAARAEQRHTGTCWRCQAHVAGKVGQGREAMRPGIDRAELVPGLEELGPSDRRRLAEADGNCWFCGSKRRCEMCVKNMDLDFGQNTLAEKRCREGEGKVSRKKPKYETGHVQMSLAPSPFFQQHLQTTLHQPYQNQEFGYPPLDPAIGFNHSYGDPHGRNIIQDLPFDWQIDPAIHGLPAASYNQDQDDHHSSSSGSQNLRPAGSNFDIYTPVADPVPDPDQNAPEVGFPI